MNSLIDLVLCMVLMLSLELYAIFDCKNSFKLMGMKVEYWILFLRLDLGFLYVRYVNALLISNWYNNCSFMFCHFIYLFWIWL